MSLQFKDGYVTRSGDRLMINHNGRSISMPLEDWIKAAQMKHELERNAAFNKAASEGLQKCVDSAKKD